MTTRNSLMDREAKRSSLEVALAAMTGKTAKLRMMEQLQGARSIDDVVAPRRVLGYIDGGSSYAFPQEECA